MDMESGARGWSMYTVEDPMKKQIMESKELSIDLQLTEGAKNAIYWFKNNNYIKSEIQHLNKLGSSRYGEFIQRGNAIEKSYRESTKTIKDLPQEILELMMNFQNTDDWARFVTTAFDDKDLRHKIASAARRRQLKECPKFIEEKSWERDAQPDVFCRSKKPMYRVCRHFAEECNTLYSINDGIDQGDVVKIDGQPGAYKIEEWITTIAKKAFLQKSKPSQPNVYMKSIILPNSLTHIEDEAFINCKGLESITIPESVIYIGGEVFKHCHGLKSVTLSHFVTTIHIETFAYCVNLESIALPNSVTEIGYYAFFQCESLTSFIIPNSVRKIGEAIFYNCSKLQSISISNSITKIPKLAFWGCSSLTTITIPDSVTTIENAAFKGCSSLTTITIPDSVTTIKGEAFKRCSSLTTITIPDSVTAIEDYTFSGCSSLTTITIPDSVTIIKHGAFYRCSSLKTINIPVSLTSIYSDAFLECPNLDEASKSKIEKIIAETLERKTWTF